MRLSFFGVSAGAFAAVEVADPAGSDASRLQANALTNVKWTIAERLRER
jgi:hypothetical protein